MPAALLATALLLLARRASCSSATFDVAVYGATPAGIQAALAVVSEGGTAFLASPMAHLGGIMTGGLGATDVGNASAIGGASLAFFVEVCRAYGKPVPREGGCFTFEPHVAEGIFQRIVAGARIIVTTTNIMVSQAETMFSKERLKMNAMEMTTTEAS